MGVKLRAITRTIRRRSGEAKAEVLTLTEETGELLQRSIKEARRLAALARRKARGRGGRRKLKAAAALEEWADRCEKVATRSASVSRASRSRIGWCRCSTRTRGRSARASWASPTSSGSFRSWRR